MNALFILIFILLIIFIHDIYQAKHSIIHNYPIIGHFRYLFEKIGPELRQYFIENNREGLPFNRSQRSYIYASSKKENNNEGFGSDKDFSDPKHFFIESSFFPKKININSVEIPIKPKKIIGANRRNPYQPQSIINISGMSFGALSGAAVDAMNKGAKIANCYQVTGEGGLSKYHCGGADGDTYIFPLKSEEYLDLITNAQMGGAYVTTKGQQSSVRYRRRQS
jgi:glutamate synthase domain-containing protein 2